MLTYAWYVCVLLWSVSLRPAQWAPQQMLSWRNVTNIVNFVWIKSSFLGVAKYVSERLFDTISFKEHMIETDAVEWERKTPRLSVSHCILIQFNQIPNVATVINLQYNKQQRTNEPEEHLFNSLHAENSKTCVKRPLSKRQKIGFQDRLSFYFMQVKSIA